MQQVIQIQPRNAKMNCWPKLALRRDSLLQLPFNRNEELSVEEAPKKKRTRHFVTASELPSGTYETESNPRIELKVSSTDKGQAGIIRVVTGDDDVSADPFMGAPVELVKNNMHTHDMFGCFYFHGSSPWLKNVLEVFGITKLSMRTYTHLYICGGGKTLVLREQTMMEDGRERWQAKTFALKKIESSDKEEFSKVPQKAPVAENESDGISNKPVKRTATSAVEDTARKRSKREQSAPLPATPTGTFEHRLPSATQGSPVGQHALSTTRATVPTEPIPDGRYATPDYSPDKIEVRIFRDNTGRRKVDLSLLPYSGEKKLITSMGTSQDASGRVLQLHSVLYTEVEIFGRRLDLIGVIITSSPQTGLALSLPIVRSEEKFMVHLHRIN
ncbi:hypothetical protein FOL47_006306 [Perkinsus chesapeaki]|uniref:Uncharacterized protein n=1 Tax=Perkinsus chesapeaki TaxID=330153 RepID=A0A7J6MXN8_PERCH|nr:hypothetical protein FOL47_006306 [Perkinsus chesapeaki]